MVAVVVSMVSMVLLTSSLLVEGERVGEGTLVPRNVSSQPTSSQGGIGDCEGEQHKLQHPPQGLQVVNRHEHCQDETEAAEQFHSFIA